MGRTRSLSLPMMIASLLVIVTGVAAPPPATTALSTTAPSIDDVPLFPLGGAAGLPAYLKAGAATLADETGIIATGELRTVASDFVNRDFTFDIVYRNRPGEKSIFHFGIGGSDWQLHSRVHGPGHGGLVTYNITAQPEAHLGRTADHPGPHLIRLEKRGKSLTMSLCVAFDGTTFEPTFSKTLPDLAAAAPALKRHNSPLFVGTGTGGTIEAVRLTVDGKPARTGAEEPIANAAADAGPGDDDPMFKLAGTAGLPAYLKATGTALASNTGIVAEEFRTTDTSIINKDFTFDVVLRFKDDKEKAIVMVGLGVAGQRVSETVYSRVHGPGHDGMCTFAVAGQPEGPLGKLSHGAGPHLFRLQKRGKTLTMAISPDFDGKFDPVAVKTLPDLKAAAPNLTPRDTVLFIKGSTSIEAVRLWVDGKPANTGRPLSVAKATVPTTKPGATGPAVDPAQQLVRLDKKLPPFFQKQVGLRFDRGGGLALGNSGVRSAASDFLTKDFTFDVVYRIAPDNDDNVFVGIGEDKMEDGQLATAAGAHLFGAKHNGMARLRLGRAPETVIGHAGGQAGPHLYRLRKVGNALTIAISPNFTGMFDPAVSSTIPDLKAVAPFLTSRNSALVIRGTGVIEQARLVVGEAVELQDLAAVPSLSAPEPDPSSQPVVVEGVARVARRQTSIRGLTVSFTDTGAMLGGTTDLILTATPGEARHDTPVTFVTPVGDQMKLVVDDVLRSVRIRYPLWEAEKVELTFDDRVSSKDGSSIGAAVGTLILSMLQGFEIDPDLAMTGDVTADGKVRAIGGVVAKIRAATNSNASIVALPADNFEQVADGLVYEGPTLLSKIQVIGVDTLDDAAATARVDRPEKLAQAMKLFAEVQEALKKSPDPRGKVVREKLARVVELAPNHHSAQLLLLVSQGKQPRRLSSGASLYYMAVAIRGVMPALQEQALATNRQRVTPGAVKEGLKSLERLRWIADPAMQPLVDAYREFIRAVSEVQSGRGSIENLRAKARAVNDAEAKVNANRDVMEKMLKEGV